MNLSRLLENKETDSKLLSILKSMLNRFLAHNISQIGGQLAYFFLLSIFPFAIFLNALIGTLHFSAAEIEATFASFLPKEVISIVTTYIEYISQQNHTSLLSVGLLVTLFSASRAIRSLDYAINKAYDIERQRGFFGTVILSILLTVGIGVTLILSLVLLSLGENIMIWLSARFPSLLIPLLLLEHLRWIIVLLDLFIVLACMYYFVPNRKMRWRSVLPGTVFSVAGWILLTMGFSLYLNHFANYSLVYGSLGAIIILMVWLYLIGILLVLGGELNCIIEQKKGR